MQKVIAGNKSREEKNQFNDPININLVYLIVKKKIIAYIDSADKRDDQSIFLCCEN